MMAVASNSCGRPFYQYLAEAASGNSQAIMNWVSCPYAASGIGTTGFGFFFILMVGVGLLNWSESYALPAVWVTLMSGVLVAYAPGPLVSKLFGIVVGGVALLFIGLVFYLR